MKKVILTLGILLLFLSACGKTEPPPATTLPPVPETTVPVQTEAPPVLEPQERGALYEPILDAYYNALEENWGIEKYMEANMNYLPGIVGDPTLVGYYLVDLNNDDIPELLIGCVGENYIYTMYTIVDSAPLAVVHGSERNTYQLVSDGAFFNRGSNGAASAGYNFYTFEGGALHFQDALIFDAAADPDNPWFYAMDEDWDVSNDLPYGTGDAEAHIALIEDSLVDIPYIPFSEYKN